MSFKRFEELPIFEEARAMSRVVYCITTDKKFNDFSLKDQMRRAVVSVVSNIAEGFERGSNREFIHFLFIARGSLGELRAQVYISFDNPYVVEREFQDINARCLELSSQISNFIKYLRNSKFTSLRYKEK